MAAKTTAMGSHSAAEGVPPAAAAEVTSSATTTMAPAATLR
jgi:hypothetical protein